MLQVLRPVIRQVEKGGTVPRWAGLDVLRGALFCLQRQAHFSGAAITWDGPMKAIRPSRHWT
jgi:hypothetical protein